MGAFGEDYTRGPRRPGQSWAARIGDRFARGEGDRCDGLHAIPLSDSSCTHIFNPCTHPAAAVGAARTNRLIRSEMTIEPRVPEWVIRQGFACVFVEAPSETEAVKLAAKRLGHMGGWKVGPDVDQEVFPASEFREYAKPGDYTRSVIVAPRLR